jgi:hypothetical protein
MIGSLIDGELPARLSAWDGSTAGPVTGPAVAQPTA